MFLNYIKLSPEDKEARKIKAHRQFKACVRIVIHNIQWYSGVSKPHSQDEIIHRRHNIESLFTTFDKILLKKPVNLRTEEEMKYLFKIISNTKLFISYPLEVRKAIFGHMYFNNYGADRMITRQGDPSTTLYFLISGKIQKYKHVVNPISNMVEIEFISDDIPGSTFGEMGILNLSPRRFYRKTLTPIEFLYISKEDLEEILKNTVKDMWDIIEGSISNIPYFQQYNIRKLRELIIASKVIEFKRDEVVFGIGCGLTDYTHVILEGVCHLIESLMVIPKRKHLLTEYELYEGIIELEKSSHERFTEQKRPHVTKIPPNVEIHYMQICKMKSGSVLNVGECVKNRSLVAASSVKCVAIPLYWLNLHDKNNVWQSLKHFLDRQLPTTKQVFNEFINNRKWLRYRQMLHEDILAEHFYPSYNTNENIAPYYRVQFQIPKD